MWHGVPEIPFYSHLFAHTGKFFRFSLVSLVLNFHFSFDVFLFSNIGKICIKVDILGENINVKVLSLLHVAVDIIGNIQAFLKYKAGGVTGKWRSATLLHGEVVWVTQCWWQIQI